LRSDFLSTTDPERLKAEKRGKAETQSQPLTTKAPRHEGRPCPGRGHERERVDELRAPASGSDRNRIAVSAVGLISVKSLDPRLIFPCAPAFFA